MLSQLNFITGSPSAAVYILWLLWMMSAEESEKAICSRSTPAPCRLEATSSQGSRKASATTTADTLGCQSHSMSKCVCRVFFFSAVLLLRTNTEGKSSSRRPLAVASQDVQLPQPLTARETKNVWVEISGKARYGERFTFPGRRRGFLPGLFDSELSREAPWIPRLVA